MLAGMDVRVWAKQHRLPLTKANLATNIAEHPICLQYGTITWGDQLASWWQVVYIEPFLSWLDRVLE